VESINKANQLAQQRTAVDILNAVILLIKLEGGRFRWHKQKAWERDNQLLMELGLALMEEAFADVDIRDYIMSKTVLLCTISNDCMAPYWDPREAYVMSYQANAILKT
jgi:hypothetical protein